MSRRSLITQTLMLGVPLIGAHGLLTAENIRDSLAPLAGASHASSDSQPGLAHEDRERAHAVAGIEGAAS